MQQCQHEKSQFCTAPGSPANHRGATTAQPGNWQMKAKNFPALCADWSTLCTDIHCLWQHELSVPVSWLHHWQSALGTWQPLIDLQVSHNVTGSYPHVYTLGNRQPTIIWQECSRFPEEQWKGDVQNQWWRKLLVPFTGTHCLWHITHMRKLLVKSNRQMFELLIIRGSFDEHKDWMACARVWSSHIELRPQHPYFK